MGLVGKINRRVLNSIAKFGCARGVQRGEIRGRSAADKKSTCSFRKTAEAAKPIDNGQLDGRRGRSAEPGTVENVEAGSERVRHRADEIPRARDESKEARMIDGEI